MNRDDDTFEEMPLQSAGRLPNAESAFGEQGHTDDRTAGPRTNCALTGEPLSDWDLTAKNHGSPLRHQIKIRGITGLTIQYPIGAQTQITVAHLKRMVSKRISVHTSQVVVVSLAPVNGHRRPTYLADSDLIGVQYTDLHFVLRLRAGGPGADTGLPGHPQHTEPEGPTAVPEADIAKTGSPHRLVPATTPAADDVHKRLAPVIPTTSSAMQDKMPAPAPTPGGSVTHKQDQITIHDLLEADAPDSDDDQAGDAAHMTFITRLAAPIPPPPAEGTSGTSAAEVSATFQWLGDKDVLMKAENEIVVMGVNVVDE